MDDFLDYLLHEDNDTPTGSILVRVTSIVGDLLIERELPLTSTIADVKEHTCAANGVPAGEQQLVLLTTGFAPLSNFERLAGLVGDGPLELCMVRVERRLALSWGADRSMRLWDMASGALLHDFGGHRCSSVPLGVEVDPTWAQALSWGGAMTMRLWDLQQGISLRTLYDNTSMRVCGMRVDWPRNRALSWGSGAWLQLWDLESSMCRELRGHAAHGLEVQWELHRAVSWGEEDVLLWDLQSAQPLLSLWDPAGVRLCAVEPGWSRALVASGSNVLRLWDWAMDGVTVEVQLTGTLRAPAALVDWDLARGFAWDSNVLCLWNELGECQRQRLPGLCAVHVDWPADRAATWTLWGARLQLQLWRVDRSTGHFRREGKGSSCQAGAKVQLQLDWPRLRALGWSCAQRLQLWDLGSGGLHWELEAHAGDVCGLAVDWELERALSWSSGDASLALWDLEQGALLRRLQREPAGSFGVCVDWAQGSALSWTAHRCFGNDSSYTLECWDLSAAGGSDLAAPSAGTPASQLLCGHTDVVKGASIASAARAGGSRRVVAVPRLQPQPSSQLGQRLLEAHASGALAGLVAAFHEELSAMPWGVPPRGDGLRASGEPVPSGATYVPVEDAGGRPRLLIYGTASTRGPPSAASAPLCAVLAARNTSRFLLENAGWFGLTAVALARGSETGFGAIPLPRPQECSSECVCLLLGNNDAMCIAGSDCFVQVHYAEPRVNDFPRLPPDWKVRCRPSVEIFESSLKTIARELVAAGARVAIATPPPLGEELQELEECAPLGKHVRKPAMRVAAEMASAVWRVAAAEGCEVLPLFECCVQRLEALRSEGRQLVAWEPMKMFALQRDCSAAISVGVPSWDCLLPPPQRMALSHDFVHMNETCAAICCALVQTWVDVQLGEL